MVDSFVFDLVDFGVFRWDLSDFVVAVVWWGDFACEVAYVVREDCGVVCLVDVALCSWVYADWFFSLVFGL